MSVQHCPARADNARQGLYVLQALPLLVLCLSMSICFLESVQTWSQTEAVPSHASAASKARQAPAADVVWVYLALSGQVDVKGVTRSRGIKGTTALSWGVFPNREVQQPTIFDPETYMVSSA